MIACLYESYYVKIYAYYKTSRLLICLYLDLFNDNISTEQDIYCHDLGVTTDGVWIGEWIYWPLMHTTRNYK
jgi:hypothetical protein